MKNALRWLNCHAHVTPSTVSWMSVHLTILLFVASLWSRNSASRSLTRVSMNDSMSGARGSIVAYPLKDLLPSDIL